MMKKTVFLFQLHVKETKEKPLREENPQNLTLRSGVLLKIKNTSSF